MANAIKVERKTTNDNPFYGMRNTLLLFQEASSGRITESMLKEAWKEAQADPERRKMFFSLLFSVGDITARQHNFFRGKQRDTGGNSQRAAFRQILQWIKETNPIQYWKFVTAKTIVEYTGFDFLFGFRVQTQKKTTKVQQVLKPVSTEQELDKLAEFAASIIKTGNAVEQYFLAKFLTRPRTSKRKGHKKILPQTLEVMRLRISLLRKVSALCNFEVEEKEHYVNFKGYYEWRAPFIREGVNSLESYLFSSGNVKTMGDQTFYAWLEAMPATARYRVRTRLLTKDNTPKPKWAGTQLPAWYLTWEKFKEEKQTEQRKLETKVRQGMATEADVQKLTEVKKEAKVTTGAVNFSQMFHEVVLGKIDKVKVQPFLDKVNLPYNTLVFIDDSASMMNYGIKINNTFISSFEFATFIATICLLKNPEDSGRSLLGMFSRETRIVGSISAIVKSPNKLIKGAEEKVSLPLYDDKLHFLENLHNIRGLMYANRTGNNTDIVSIPEYLHQWAGDDPTKIEQLMEFPVWTIITDGNWNSLHSPEASMNDFLAECEKYFGFRPYIVAIDVSSNPVPVDRFQGINNMMVVPPNPAAIEQYLMNFKDFDIVDVYLPLLSIYRSNRYEEVRKNTI